MNVVGVQLDSVWEDKAANHAKLAAMLAADPPEPGSLVVLPEMWATGFSMNVAAITETPARETEAFMAGLAAQYGIGLLGGVVTTGPDGLGRNECVLFGPEGREAARYTKMHPFSFGSETRYYGRGSEVVLFDWQGFRVAPFICYDLRFPEVFRTRSGAGPKCSASSPIGLKPGLNIGGPYLMRGRLKTKPMCLASIAVGRIRTCVTPVIACFFIRPEGC